MSDAIEPVNLAPGIGDIPAVGQSLFLVYLVDGEATWLSGTPDFTEEGARRDADRMMRHQDRGFATHFAIVAVRVVASPGLETFVSKKGDPQICEHCGAEKAEF